MSADNWTTCYACASKRDNEIAKQTAVQQKRLRDAYGQVPQSDYTALQIDVEAAINAISQKPLERTFREDYEFHGAETGVVTVSYSGQCTKCGYGTSFEDKHPISSAGGRN